VDTPGSDLVDVAGFNAISFAFGDVFLVGELEIPGLVGLRVAVVVGFTLDFATGLDTGAGALA
jgi:hypothetical protein